MLYTQHIYIDRWIIIKTVSVDHNIGRRVMFLYINRDKTVCCGLMLYNRNNAIFLSLPIFCNCSGIFTKPFREPVQDCFRVIDEDHHGFSERLNIQLTLFFLIPRVKEHKWICVLYIGKNGIDYNTKNLWRITNTSRLTRRLWCYGALAWQSENLMRTVPTSAFETKPAEQTTTWTLA